MECLQLLCVGQTFGQRLDDTHAPESVNAGVIRKPVHAFRRVKSIDPWLHRHELLDSLQLAFFFLLTDLLIRFWHTRSDLLAGQSVFILCRLLAVSGLLHSTDHGCVPRNREVLGVCGWLRAVTVELIMPEPRPYFIHRKNGTSLDNQSALGCEIHFDSATPVACTQLPTWQLRKLAAASAEDVEALTRSALVTADFGHNRHQALRKWTVKDAAVQNLTKCHCPQINLLLNHPLCTAGRSTCSYEWPPLLL